MQTESSVTKTSGSSSKTSKPAAANIDGHFSHYVLWEQRFQWAYYSHSKEGWLCKTCKEFCDSGDQYWKTKAVKHGNILGICFQGIRKVQNMATQKKVNKVF